MNLVPVIFFGSFFAIILFIKFKTNETVLKIISINLHAVYEKSDVKCETYASGARDDGYAFRRCDLKFLEDALLIIGFVKLGKFKLYKRVYIITQNEIAYSKKFIGAKVFKPKKINLNSFNNDIFIECGESSFTTTSYDFRLKNLSDGEKSFIKI